jgi:hypothetical protein
LTRYRDGHVQFGGTSSWTSVSSNGPCRPSKPARVLRHEIEEDVAIDQYGRHSVIAGQGHNRIGAHRNIAATS